MLNEYKSIKTTSPGRRGIIQFKHSEIYKGRSVKCLTRKKHEMSGRNNAREITIRHRGERCKKVFRIMIIEEQQMEVC